MSKDSRPFKLPLCLGVLRACFPIKPGMDNMWESSVCPNVTLGN